MRIFDPFFSLLLLLLLCPIILVFPILYTILNQVVKPDLENHRSNTSKKCGFYLMMIVFVIDVASTVFGLVSPTGFGQVAPSPSHLCWTGAAFTTVTCIPKVLFVFFWICTPMIVIDPGKYDSSTEWLISTWNSLHIIDNGAEGDVSTVGIVTDDLAVPASWPLYPSMYAGVLLVLPLSVVSAFYM